MQQGNERGGGSPNAMRLGGPGFGTGRGRNGQSKAKLTPRPSLWLPRWSIHRTNSRSAPLDGVLKLPVVHTPHSVYFRNKLVQFGGTAAAGVYWYGNSTA